MSRFFRGSSNSSSSSEEEDDDTQDISKSQQLETLKGDGGATLHRDMLLHALLEERCMNDVLRESQSSRIARSRQDMEREGRLRYQRLCSQLTSLDLVTAGLEHEQHSESRETYRNGLDVLLSQNISGPQAAVSRPFRNLLLTSASTSSLPFSTLQPVRKIGPVSLLNPAREYSLSSSQYLRDFEEIGMLGKGGFGTVFQVKHRLDNHVYAVKKVKISSSAVARIHSTQHQPELEGLLAELRTLARLEHPNVVRYYSSWVEWTCPSTHGRPSSDEATFSYSNSVSMEELYAPSTGSAALHRIITAGTETVSLDDVGVTFEDSSHDASSSNNGSDARSTSSVPKPATLALEARGDNLAPKPIDHLQGVQTQASARTLEYTSSEGHIATSEPMLALHIQMAMYPMTLADFLWPKAVANNTRTSGLKPLAHCYHLEASIRIMLALLEGVDYIHSRGIVHRDLKPANIFLRLEKNVHAKHGHVDLTLCSACRATASISPAVLSICIGDFGLVGSIADQINAATISSPPRGSPVGTELYRPLQPPSSIGPQIDIFALGIIAFELLYKFSTQMERRETLQNLRLGQFPPHMPPQAIDIISAMLSEDSEKHTTVLELRSRLSAMLPP